MRSNNHSESEIIAGCLKKDSKFQEIFYRLYCNEMFVICRSYAKDHEAAKDVLQESYIKAFKHLPQYKAKSSLKAWLRRIVINTSIDQYRRSVRLRNTVRLDDVCNQTVQDDVLATITAQELYSIIKELPKGFRTIFNLYVVEGYNHQEIAEKLGISEGTSKSQLSRARKALEERITKLYDNGHALYARAR